MLAVLLTTVLLYLVFPWDLIGWHKADVRMLPLIFMLILTVPPPMRRRSRQVAFMGVVGTIAAVGLVPIADGLARGSDQVSEYVAGMDAVPLQSRILPVFCNSARPKGWKLSYAINPLTRADSYYAMARGGASGNSLARNNTLYWIWYKNYRSRSDFPRLDVKQPTPQQILAAASAYDAIILWNDSEKTDIQRLFAEQGFSPVFEQQRLTILTRSTVETEGVASQ
jgi:hypothetical protein